MSNIANYSHPGERKFGDDIKQKKNNPSEQIAEFSKYLLKFMPVLEKEFNTLERLNANRPNAIFPIKMKALSDIYQAAGPLYEWYVAKAKGRM